MSDVFVCTKSSTLFLMRPMSSWELYKLLKTLWFDEPELRQYCFPLRHITSTHNELINGWTIDETHAPLLP